MTRMTLTVLCLSPLPFTPKTSSSPRIWRPWLRMTTPTQQQSGLAFAILATASIFSLISVSVRSLYTFKSPSLTPSFVNVTLSSSRSLYIEKIIFLLQ